MRFITLLTQEIRGCQVSHVYGNIYHLISLILLHLIHSWQNGVGAVLKFGSRCAHKESRKNGVH